MTWIKDTLKAKQQVINTLYLFTAVFVIYYPVIIHPMYDKLRAMVLCFLIIHSEE